MLDLGGASTQIVLEPMAKLDAALEEGEHKYDLSFCGKTRMLYGTSTRTLDTASCARATASSSSSWPRKRDICDRTPAYIPEYAHKAQAEDSEYANLLHISRRPAYLFQVHCMDISRSPPVVRAYLVVHHPWGCSSIPAPTQHPRESPAPQAAPLEPPSDTTNLNVRAHLLPIASLWPRTSRLPHR
ncbi:hypothetical protein TRAPUB_4 [Trametes pubescens]|uniref:Guanosine-diphosphatase n=1 Tax=Trametes pubescens TaxID=154538 RepID=A0A1M2VNB1_TRAPU|nr:hypothetical protein TRAPUB_4 [Trametes pubescens]